MIIIILIYVVAYCEELMEIACLSVFAIVLSTQISLLITHNYQYNEHCESHEYSYISSKANQMSKYFRA